jgi:hypothetical protein
MSGYGYPKFAWMARVLEDRWLSPVAKTVLVYCALQYVKGPEDTFCVRQQTVAANLGISRAQTVGDAFAKARKLGWLELAEERQRGRGRHQADIHRLTFPVEIETSERCYYDAEHQRAEAEIPTRDGRNTNENQQKYQQNPTLLPAKTTPLQGIDTGFSTGFNLQGVAREHEHNIFDAEIVNDNSDPTPLRDVFSSLFGKSEP